MNEDTFVMLKPGALRRKKVRYILNRIINIGLKINAWEIKELDPKFVFEHYKHLIRKDLPYDVYDRTQIEALSGEVIGLIVSGENAISKMRELIGPKFVRVAQENYPQCIRALGDPNNNPDNLIHASDSPENAREEIKNFFGDNINIDLDHLSYPCVSHR